MKNWIQAARLRTLPLSLSGIIVGSAYAYYQHQFNWIIFALAILTTLSFQILSNFANDYGDGIKGTDANRIGEKRLVASGEITSKEMKQAVVITGIISLVMAVSLIYVSFGKENFGYSLLFFVLGIASIVAAIKYTVGNNAYGYSGFGDVFVFVFFGMVSVLGSNFLYTKALNWKLMLPAIAIGMLSVAVLNLNNMRDIENDRLAGKNTLIVKFGLRFGLWYQRVLVFVPVILYTIFMFNFKNGTPGFLILFFYLAVAHNKSITKIVDPKDFDPHLKKVALSTVLFAILIAFKLIAG